MTRDDVLWKRGLRRVWALQLRVRPKDTRRVRVRQAASTSPRPAAADPLLEAAPTDRHRAWLRAAAASGAPPATLAAFAARTARLRPHELRRALDPFSQPRGALRQQSSTTCGSASLVVARMLNDPVYALLVLDGYDAGTGDVADGDLRTRFAEQEREVKRRTNDHRDGSGGLTVPWPHRLGTPPWGARQEMDGRAGVPGTTHRVLVIDSDGVSSRGRAFAAVTAAVRRGHVCPLFVGDGAVPRHVVLAVGSRDGLLNLYDPAMGGPATVRQDDFVTGAIDVAGWKRPWAAVIPATEHEI